MCVCVCGYIVGNVLKIWLASVKWQVHAYVVAATACCKQLYMPVAIVVSCLLLFLQSFGYLTFFLCIKLFYFFCRHYMHDMNLCCRQLISEKVQNLNWAKYLTFFNSQRQPAHSRHSAATTTISVSNQQPTTIAATQRLSAWYNKIGIRRMRGKIARKWVCNSLCKMSAYQWTPAEYLATVVDRKTKTKITLKKKTILLPTQYYRYMYKQLLDSQQQHQFTPATTVF